MKGGQGPANHAAVGGTRDAGSRPGARPGTAPSGLAGGLGRVELPFATERKDTSAATDRHRQYVFPSATLGTDRGRREASPSRPPGSGDAGIGEAGGEPDLEKRRWPTRRRHCSPMHLIEVGDHNRNRRQERRRARRREHDDDPGSRAEPWGEGFGSPLDGAGTQRRVCRPPACAATACVRAQNQRRDLLNRDDAGTGSRPRAMPRRGEGRPAEAAGRRD